MRILQVFDFMSLPYGGGTVDIVYRLSRVLAARGHQVTVCTGDHELDDTVLRLEESGVALWLEHSRINRCGLYWMPDLRHFDVSRYDIIHFHCYRSLQNAVLFQKALKAGVPYIIDAHGSTVKTGGVKGLLKGVYDLVWGRKLLGNAARLVAETETGVQEYHALGADPDKIRVVHPGLDVEEFDELPQKGLFRLKYGIGRSSFLILFVGRIHKAKGIETLVEALSIMLREDKDTHLAIVGQDDGHRVHLEKQIRELGIRDRVTFTGFLSGQDKLSAMVDADVLVQPSKNEGGARPSLEALLCGTPVAVTRGTGAGDEIEKFNGGLLFYPRDVGELVERLLSVRGHPRRLLNKTTRAQKWIRENLSFDRQVEEYEKVYQEAVRES